MTRDEAVKILDGVIQADGHLSGGAHYTYWQFGSDEICLDSDFPIEYIEAVVWWIKNSKDFVF